MALTDNLVSYYKFDENTGTSVADATGTNNGTFNGSGTLWASGIINSGGNFVNTNSNYVLCKSGKILAGQSSWTITAWIKSSAANNGNGVVIYCERASSGNDIFKMQINQSSPWNDLELVLRDDAGSLQFFNNSTDVIKDGTFHFCAITNSSGTLQAYVDGSADGASAAQTPSNTYTNSGIESRIGTDAGDSGANYTGVTDEVGLWTRALSSTEISELYNGGAGLQYPFTTASVKDIIGSGFIPFAR